MKNLCAIIIILCSMCSCKDETERLYETMDGTWKLSRMEYLDSTGIVKIIEDSETMLIFSFNNDLMITSTGQQIIGKDTLVFGYRVSPDDANFLFALPDIKKMPIDAIGRVQVYDFQKISKKKVEFSIGQEYDFITGGLYKNVLYQFTKIK